MGKTTATGTARTMSPDKWARVKELFSVMAGSPVEQRDELAQKLCEGDSELQSEIMKLLAAENAAGSFLEETRTETLFSSNKSESMRCLRLGQVVARRFQIRRVIGRGGMGEVYEAWDNELQQKVALKTIRQEIAAHPGVISRFKTEVKESLRITHPNVCRVYQLACDEQEKGRLLWFLTMELLEGETLAQYLEQHRRIPARRAVALIRQIVAGLACAHQAGIVHRDLKPGNLMLVGAGTSEERLLITDFGLAVSSSSGDHANTGGTPAYMAPEQAAGGQVGPQADIWALGLIICEILTGTRPKLNRSSAKACSADVRAWLLGNPAVPHRLRAVVRRSLRLLPEQRFQDATAVAQLLEIKRGKAERAIAALIVTAAVLAIGAVIVPQIRDRVENEVQVTPNNVLSGEPSFSPNGKYLAYMSNRSNPERLDIWLQSSGATARRLTSSGRENTSPSVSPDGKRVAFWSERNGGGIYLIGADGSGERLLVPQGRNPSFSPDGQHIAYWQGAVDAQRSGQLHVISLSTGAVTRLESDFADARYPIWSPGGKIFFLGCRTARGDERDWWVLDPNSGDLQPLGLLALLRRHHIEPVFPPQIALQGDHVIVSGRTSQNYHLWDIVISQTSFRPLTAPAQITFGENDEMAFALAQNDGIALEHVTSDAHLWRVSTVAAGSKATPTPEKLTDNIEKDRCPVASADGRWLFFSRVSAKFLQIMKLEIATGKESPVFVSDSNELWPLPNYDGTIVAFQSQADNQPSILLLRNGIIRKLCSQCSHPGTWVVDGKKLLYTASNGDIATLDIDTGESRTLLRAAGRILAYPDYNAANRYLLLTATYQNDSQIFAARLSEQGDQIVGTPIALTGQNEMASMARWSADGLRFFYLSQRDGYYCLWGNSFDARSVAVGRPVAVKHYHAWDSGPSRTFPSILGISVAANWVYLNPVEVRSTVWQGLVKRTSLSRLLHIVAASLDQGSRANAGLD